MYFVYLLRCKDDSLYTGITNDLEKRLAHHKDGSGSHYTSAKGVDGIVYTEAHPSRSAALKREAEIKGWTRKKKLDFISNSVQC